LEIYIGQYHALDHGCTNITRIVSS